MKIAHIVCAYPPYFGGMGNAVYSLVNELERLGHETAVFTIGKNTTVSTEGVVGQVHRYAPLLRHGNAAYIPEIPRQLDVFDIVHLHYPFYGVANLIRKWKKRNPQKAFVLTYHMDTVASSFKGLYFSYYTKFWLPKILKAADGVIGSSKDYLASSNARFITSLEPRKCHYIPFGVDVDRFYPKKVKSAYMDRFLRDKTVPTILFVGGMDDAHYFKGVDVLLKALCILFKQGISFRAVFVGGGNLKAGYELKARGMGIQSCVQFVGYVEDETLSDFYNIADVCVLPSTESNEAFGMVLLEAMACGVPVVASNLPGVRTVARVGGEVFPVGDYLCLAEKLCAVLSLSHKEKKAWSKKVRERMVSKYSWNHVAQSHEGVYKEIVGNLKK